MLPKLGTQKNGRGDKIAIEAFEINDFGDVVDYLYLLGEMGTGK